MDKNEPWETENQGSVIFCYNPVFLLTGNRIYMARVFPNVTVVFAATVCKAEFLLKTD